MIIYRITNKVNGKSYVGLTIQDLTVRFKQHGYKNSCCIKLRNAIQKYGKENFTVETIEKCSNLDELKKKESGWIAKLNTLHPKGYNLTTGGEHHTVNEESIKKIIEKIQKAVFGISLSDKNIIFYKQIKLTKKDGFAYRAISECCKNKRLSHKGYVWIYKEAFDKMSQKEIEDKVNTIKEKRHESYKKRGSVTGEQRQKAVIGTNIKTKEIIELKSIRSAKTVNLCPRSIQLCLKGTYKQYKGFIWKYKESIL